uniref:hypothetical protein n=1 Tax=Mycobacterium sp. TaxID=1785 RepID=UPI003F98BBDA
ISGLVEQIIHRAEQRDHGAVPGSVAHQPDPPGLASELAEPAAADQSWLTGKLLARLLSPAEEWNRRGTGAEARDLEKAE